ncbi:hypothetical protein OF83DRAFT_1140487 [Amylostereum chailletii]|nr:hypothetical protein OF83DRAFT_1140487 [Amylostereum chailletii]
MSGRLASFRGPSTPTSSPVSAKNQLKSPASPSRSTESTYHRKVRTTLQDLRSVCRTWDDLVSMDGLKAVQKLVDARTDLDNQLSLVPDGALPRTRVVGPKLSYMEDRIADMDLVVSKLRKQFAKMVALVDGLEAVVAEAHKTKGWAWVHSEPLWTSWSLEKFATSISSILHPYRRSLDQHIELANTLRPHSASFEVSRDAITSWVEEPWLEEDGWDAKWEDLCLTEIDRWDTR